MSLKKRLDLVIFLTIVVGLAYLLLAPVPITPAAWTPPVAPTLSGQYAQNTRLSAVQKLLLGEGHKPEDVALDVDGKIYGGFEDGRIVVLQPDGTQPRVFADTHGRPLGLIFDGRGNLIVADAIKGLLSINKSGEIKVLAVEADGEKFGCLNDLDVGADGTIYFTEASRKFPMSQFANDLLEHQPNGRLLAFDPQTQKPRTLLRDLYFANGVAVSPDQSFVLVAETGKYQVRRVWLKGPQAGHDDVFIDNLPGFPDGISSNGKDKFWLALVTPRQAVFDRMLPHPFIRKMVLRLPRFLQPAPQRYSFVLGLDSQAKVVENLQNGSPDCYAEIANVVERNGTLYFGSIGEDTIGRFRLR
ncbi:MAG TPA: SMP-30/gluconolactonase/LRE family protein [Pyrinomonadaceae bacterium]|jgi:sugar lactone lactonase YvrE|nr:SMP-30/gluconolactonase/LRE family protein [Pyrinomonadaceae bacterium]